MGRIDEMNAFVAVVQSGGFTAASKRLGMPIATVSRKVASLEKQLGVQLLRRTTRRHSLTDVGERYYMKVQQILLDLSHLEQELTEAHTALRGQLVIASPTPFGARYLAPTIAAFLQQNPDVSVRQVLSNLRTDYLEQGIDVGLRVGPLHDSSMRHIKLGEMRIVLCASTEYLKTHGAPSTPEDLSGHSCAAYLPYGDTAGWAFRDSRNQDHSVPIDATYMADSVDAVVRFVLEGGGIGRFYAYQVADALEDQKLRLILQEYEVKPHVVSLQYPELQYLPQRTRAFLDFVKPRLRHEMGKVAGISPLSG